MPNSDIASPPVATPVDRTALGVDSVRAVGGVSANPSWSKSFCSLVCYCLEASQE